jgi:3,4-dihydroxy 2-butanone 4-phosphate synthase/GTP cyclohydrolase II
MDEISVELLTCARIPTEMGEFRLCYYGNNVDDKEHVALIAGDVRGKDGVLVRVHSECFTGDVLGSLRCDCGPQLQKATQLIAEKGAGAIIYLRQEGRGIGLLDKLRAYNLQDDGYDTVEANQILGHQADSRDYAIAALILQDLGVFSVRLMTNNPDKIASLHRYGIEVADRIPLQTGVNQENMAYLQTKAKRMQHMLDLEPFSMLLAPKNRPNQDKIGGDVYERPFVTLSYAQSLDGSITARRGEPLAISGPESMEMTHRLRAEHDAILVGIGTVLSDNPRLSVRLVDGLNPQPIIVDSKLRCPLSARLLRNDKPPWIATTETADYARQNALEAAGAQIFRLPALKNGRVDLQQMLAKLAQLGIRSLMVEGGAEIISSFLAAHLVDRLVLTIAPMLVGGLNAVAPGLDRNGVALPRLFRTHYQKLGNDIILLGDLG